MLGGSHTDSGGGRGGAGGTVRRAAVCGKSPETGVGAPGSYSARAYHPFALVDASGECRGNLTLLFLFGLSLCEDAASFVPQKIIKIQTDSLLRSITHTNMVRRRGVPHGHVRARAHLLWWLRECCPKRAAQGSGQAAPPPSSGSHPPLSSRPQPGSPLSHTGHDWFFALSNFTRCPPPIPIS